MLSYSISAKQLLIKRYLKRYEPPPDFASETTLVQIITLFSCTIKHDTYIVLLCIINMILYKDNYFDSFYMV